MGTRPVHRLGVVVDRILGRGPPGVERELRQDREVRAALDALVEPLGEAAEAIGLPEDLRDERDRESAVFARSCIGHARSLAERRR
jgi:hypothetical protein